MIIESISCNSSGVDFTVMQVKNRFMEFDIYEVFLLFPLFPNCVSLAKLYKLFSP